MLCNEYQEKYNAAPVQVSYKTRRKKQNLVLLTFLIETTHRLFLLYFTKTILTACQNLKSVIAFEQSNVDSTNASKPISNER